MQPWSDLYRTIKVAYDFSAFPNSFLCVGRPMKSSNYLDEVEVRRKLHAGTIRV